jgi:hypothetical protein
MERIYVIDDESKKITDEVEVYDPQTDSWESSFLPERTDHATASAYNSK